jgi:subtilisin family serine protease
VTRRTLLVACALLGALAALPNAVAAAEAPAAATPPAGFVPGRVIVEWAADAGRAEKGRARDIAEVEYRANLGDPSFQLVEVEPGQSAAAAIDGLKADAAVALAERDSYSAPTSVPNDPLFGQEWGLENVGAGIDGFSGATAGADIDAPGAWTGTIGIPSIVVADIDSGYRFNSPDLGPVAWENPGEIAGNGIDDDGNGYVDDVHGYDFVGASSESPSQDDDPTDDNLVSGGHGVHTAGTIGAAGDNGIGITGVAQDVRIMPLRVCANAPEINEGRCPTSSIIAAINYAGANGARAANISLGGTVKSTAELDAFAENPQTLFVIAAGNDSQNNDSVKHYPCDYEPGSTFTVGAVENIVCVAATDQADELAGFSNWGPDMVDLGAPGTQILSTFPAMEDLIDESFEQEDFETKWKSTGADGGFARTNEPPLTSFGISDSPGAAAAAGSVRESILTAAIPVPSGYGACQFSGRRSVSLGGGTFNQRVLKDGVSVFSSNPANTSGSAMVPFLTVPITGLAGSSVTLRFRYTAGPSPSASSGVWLDDLKLTCYAPVSTPPEYEYLQGTSMAAPHVTGTAALLFSLKPTATVDEVRDALLSSVDPDASLEGLTVTGGRLDAAKALAHLEPPAPLLTSTDPASPAEDADPRILGSTAAGSRVLIFLDAGCHGASVQQGTAAELASPGLSVHVPDESTAQFSAIVETHFNSSPCSAPISYTNSIKLKDEEAPAKPVLGSTDPPSPANENQPKIVGSAEAGAIIAIYAGASCEKPPVASGSAAELAAPGIAVTVPDNSVSQFSANATDAAFNTSACSKPISYTESSPDEIAPAAPLLSGTSPASPAAASAVRVLGTAEPGSTIDVYRGAHCEVLVANGTAADLESPGIAVDVPAATTYEFSARATDLAQNSSLCSEPLSYTNSTKVVVIGPGEITTEPLQDPFPVAMPPAASTEPMPTVACRVPRVAGKTLSQAKSALATAGCRLGRVAKPRVRKGKGQPTLVVRSSSPAAGSGTVSGVVNLTLGAKPKRHHH